MQSYVSRKELEEGPQRIKTSADILKKHGVSRTGKTRKGWQEGRRWEKEWSDYFPQPGGFES